MKTSWRRLSSSSSNVFIKTNIFTLVIRLQKTSSRLLGQDHYIRLGHTSSRRLGQYSSWSYVFKTSWSRPIYSRRFQDVFKTSSSYLQDLLQKRLQNVFYTFLRPTARTVIYRRIFLGYTSETFMVSVQNLLTDAYLEPSPTSTMDFFAKILLNFKLLTPSLAKKTP